jgi:hypothetical protein
VRSAGARHESIPDAWLVVPDYRTCGVKLHFSDYGANQELKVFRYYQKGRARPTLEMRLSFEILISTLAGLLSAVLGWFCGYGAGVLLELGDDGSLGTGLPTVVLMYGATLLFGIVGFAVCLMWLFKKAKRVPPVR